MEFTLTIFSLNTDLPIEVQRVDSSEIKQFFSESAEVEAVDPHSSIIRIIDAENDICGELRPVPSTIQFIFDNLSENGFLDFDNN